MFTELTVSEVQKWLKLFIDKKSPTLVLQDSPPKCIILWLSLRIWEHAQTRPK